MAISPDGKYMAILHNNNEISITPLVKASDGTQYTATFDRNSDTTNQGKIRVSAAGATSGAELAATTDLSGYSSGFSIEGN